MADTLADVLEELLAARPGQTPDELYGALGRHRQKVRDIATVATVLKGKRDRFLAQPDGRWCLRRSASESPTSHLCVADRDEQAADSPRTLAASEVERELAERLRGCRMVCEIGLDASLHERIEPVLTEVVRRTRDLDRLGRVYPSLLVTYLVGHGVYRYEGGRYWNTMPIQGLEDAGPTFEQALRRLGLETFEDLVVGDGAQRYVGPIVAHGGIPKYCLGDYFALVARGLRRAAAGSELLSIWRSQKTTFANIDRPVRRFLLFGGDLAVDFVDRSIDLFRDHARSGAIPRPADVGLPPYVVASFRKFIATTGTVSVPDRPAHSRARIVIDPWDGSGPVAELPVSAHAGDTVWRVHGEGHLERVSGSCFSVRRVRLRPSKSWTVERIDDGTTSADTVFEGLDVLPSVFFEPATGALVRSAVGIGTDVVWMLAPSGTDVTGIGPDGTRVPVPIAEQLPPLGAHWTGFELQAITVRGLRALAVKAGSQPEQRVPVRSALARPDVRGDLVANVTTPAGLPVFSEPPVVDLPDLPEGSPPWRVRLAVNGADVALSPEDVDRIVRGEPLPVRWGCCEAAIAVRGPLGMDLRAWFSVAPGLVASMPDRLLFPGESAVVHLASPRLSLNRKSPGSPVETVVEEADDTVAFSAADDRGRHLDLIARVSRVLWVALREHGADVSFGTHLARLAAADMSSAEPPRIAVRIGTTAHVLRLGLESDGETLQMTDRTRPGGSDGRWVFDLGVFSDTVRSAESGRLNLVLWVGERPVTVASIRPDFDAADLRASHVAAVGDVVCVELSFTSRPLRHRVARLWSLDRPWIDPIIQAVPDDSETGVAVMRDRMEMPPGRYLAEIAIDDGWSSVARPRPESAQTTRVDIDGDSLGGDGPADIVQNAVVRGYYPRRLERDELTIAVPIATQALVLMQSGHLLVGADTPQFEAIASIAVADPSLFASELVDLAEEDRVEPSVLLHLAISIGHRLKAAQALPHSTARRLWAIAPAIASAFELSVVSETERVERIREFGGWDPDQPCGEIPVGEAVRQLFIGMDAEQLVALEHAVGLLPQTALHIDSYAAATFEWLLADKAAPGAAEGWWARRRSLLQDVRAAYPGAAAHLDARVPPAGTERWAALPEATLAAALEVVTSGHRAVEACRALSEIVAFAPQLVAHDLVLARALTDARRSTTKAEA